ncbi:MAG: polymer-forming cytoskeletal protein [bacterium]|nr:polymer-forming cytoskeletal protein [bacterium]
MKKRATVAPDSPDRLNVIVEGSKVVGDMITESNLRIDGIVEGNVTVASKIVIGKTGQINGNLTCGDADIEGKIDGLIKVEGLLTLRSSARIVGEITTSKLQVEEGANFSGNCTMSNAGAKPVSRPAAEPEENVIY